MLTFIILYFLYLSLAAEATGGTNPFACPRPVGSAWVGRGPLPEHDRRLRRTGAATGLHRRRGRVLLRWMVHVCMLCLFACIPYGNGSCEMPSRAGEDHTSIVEWLSLTFCLPIMYHRPSGTASSACLPPPQEPWCPRI